MSLRRIKIIYYIAVASIAMILICTAGPIGLVAAVLILAGALPMFMAVGKAMKAATLHDVEQQARLIADQTEPLRQPKPRQDQHPQST